ncbi:hypothetical protein R1flu_007301 [Riccia fluitans]|uniref:Fe2OG dioxygenase domain-containing protein n=1 Tax=Riccia fluitans TaxID=41844 RepID=A0ABD1YYG7_9MARC
MDVQQYVVGSLDTIFYIPDFLTSVEQDFLYRQVKSAPVAKWKSLKNRRLQNWGGVVHEKGLIPQPCRTFYEPGQGIMPHQDGPLYFPVVAIISLGSPTLMRFSPHSKIANNEEGHASESNVKGADTLKDDDKKEANCQIKKERSLKDVSLILMPGSLLLFKDSAYGDYLHGIDECVEHHFDGTVLNPEVAADEENLGEEVEELKDPVSTSDARTLRRTGTRISLTCRYVPKVVLSKLFKL